MNRATSLYLDLLRFLAAATVFSVHANYERFTGGLPLLWRVKDLGNDAVMVFFVLSGFVIAYVADTKETTFKDYFVSRLARLYSVAAPAIVLTVALDFLGSRIWHVVYEGWWFEASNPLWRIMANGFFVNELWFSSVRLFSNGPYWSLGYEFWYYIIFAAAWYLRSPFRYFSAAALCLFAGPKILLLFPVWLLGVGVYFWNKDRRISEVYGWMLFWGSVIGYGLFRYEGCPQLFLDWTAAALGSEFVHDDLRWSQTFLSSYVIGLLIAAHFTGLVAIAPRLASVLQPFERVIRYLAGYTFALYLFHYPLLQFFAAVSHNIGSRSVRVAIVVLGTLGAAWALGSITEEQKSLLRRKLLYLYERVEGTAPEKIQCPNPNADRA